MTHRKLTPKLARQLTLNTEPWLSCDDCFTLLDQFVDRLLADPNDVDPAMAAHLRGCGACAEEAESLVELAAHDAGIDAQPLLVRLSR